jgi:hypothetical protein
MIDISLQSLHLHVAVLGDGCGEQAVGRHERRAELEHLTAHQQCLRVQLWTQLFKLRGGRNQLVVGGLRIKRRAAISKLLREGNAREDEMREIGTSQCKLPLWTAPWTINDIDVIEQELMDNYEPGGRECQQRLEPVRRVPPAQAAKASKVTCRLLMSCLVQLLNERVVCLSRIKAAKSVFQMLQMHSQSSRCLQELFRVCRRQCRFSSATPVWESLGRSSSPASGCHCSHCRRCHGSASRDHFRVTQCHRSICSSAPLESRFELNPQMCRRHS